MTQGFLKVSRKLGLTPENDEAQDSIAAKSKVNDWLQQTGAEAIHVRPFDSEAGRTAFRSLLKQKISSPADMELAAKIVDQLGGLPLAIAQISGYINQQRYSLKEFLPLYIKNASKIDQKRVSKVSYEHTLSTVWTLSLEKLSGEAATLQNLLAFFDPDKIHESMLLEGGTQISDPDFEFLKDEME
ncbi:hypothetical protein AA313_de0204576 [Arthrobotrys entomopaga]|nr:hypothetical protein AA313_de0204576 [Arthrobotrys entomopaga]